MKESYTGCSTVLNWCEVEKTAGKARFCRIKGKQGVAQLMLTGYAEGCGWIFKKKNQNTQNNGMFLVTFKLVYYFEFLKGLLLTRLLEM